MDTKAIQEAILKMAAPVNCLIDEKKQLTRQSMCVDGLQELTTYKGESKRYLYVYLLT